MPIITFLQETDNTSVVKESTISKEMLDAVQVISANLHKQLNIDRGAGDVNRFECGERAQ